MARYARSKAGALTAAGDMSAFRFRRQFDLTFTSANTIRHVISNEAIARMWHCITDHLALGGIFPADLELGFAAEAEKVGKPSRCMMSRGETLVHMAWEVRTAPCPTSRCATIERSFESRGAGTVGIWRERFELRTYDAAEFVQLATADGRLELAAIYSCTTRMCSSRRSRTPWAGCSSYCDAVQVTQSRLAAGSTQVFV
jgi:hypothetical protein